MPLATVGVASVGSDLERAIRGVVEAAGGLKELEKGQRVMIKPNATGPLSAAHRMITTNPEVIRVVIRMVKERGCHAMVGDRPATLDMKTFKMSGFEQVCREEGAELYPWINDEYVRFFPKQRYWTEGFRMPKILTEVDHWINVPVLKNHQTTAAEFTCCLKSFVGVCHPEDRFQKGNNEMHQNNIGEKIAELNLCSRPIMNIVDATSIMTHGGPDGLLGKPVWAAADLVLASKDRVACDSVSLAVLKLFGAGQKVKLPYVTKSVWDQVQIYRSAELGLGQAEAAKIKVEEIKVKNWGEIKSNWT